MSNKVHAYEVVIFYTGDNDEGKNAEIVYTGQVLAPNEEIAQLASAFEIPEALRSPEKLTRLRINTRFLG